MAVSIQLRKDGNPVGDARSANSYAEVGRIVDQLRSAGLCSKASEGGSWTITFSGTSVCGTCSRVVSAPATITL